MVQETEIPNTPENLEKLKEDKNNELLQKWQELFTALNPNEIKVFIYGQENFPDYRMIEEWSGQINFHRLDGIINGSSVRLIIQFSGKLREVFGSVAIAAIWDRAFFDSSIRACEDPDWLDTLGEHGMINWQEMYDQIFTFENARRSEIPELPNPIDL